jgi:hypothetical protein
MAVGRMLRDLGLRSPRPPEPWLPGLKHLERGDDARPLVIWAVDVDRKVLREACRGFAPLLRACPDRVPVLVTNVADFSFFSRLGWLVEYLPALSSPADGYAERKKRYLAWRYRDAPILPVSAGLGLEEGMPIEELLVD